ncbi:hypothetical protein [Candidatus Sororendozoicomonas aggregata]|uniref:hypothetical protein n=1 Tax=Candidatus Sororendozoicomonas aggregata TaxID=3073239 RepID=UPI002ED5429E
MNRIKRLSLGLAACALSFPAAADSNLFADIAASSSMLAHIKHVRVRTWVAYIKLEGCAKYSKISLKGEYGKAMYSTALSAAIAGKQVRVGFAEPEGCSGVMEPYVEYIDVPFS